MKVAGRHELNSMDGMGCYKITMEVWKVMGS